MFDLHIHTNYSPDSEMTLKEACEKAIDYNLKGIAITDHMDHECYDGTAFFDTKKYRNDIERAQEKYKGRLKILIGVEEGYQKKVVDKIKDDLTSLRPDFVILSNHFSEGKDIYLPEYYEGKDRKQAVEIYLKAVIEGISEMPDFHTLGHLGYLRRYAPYGANEMGYLEFKDYYDKIFKLLIEMGKGLEINTASLSTHGYTIPDFEIIDEFIKAGGEIITLGSDAHTQKGISLGFKDVHDYLESAGLNYLCYFEQGKANFYPIK